MAGRSSLVSKCRPSLNPAHVSNMETAMPASPLVLEATLPPSFLSNYGMKGVASECLVFLIVSLI